MKSNKENDLVSVIVPVYNAERYLKIGVESIIKQTYKNIEIILINDGSKDGSLQLCKDYNEKDSRIRVIDKENSGVSAARNLGIANAKGKYVCFVDSDDYVESDYIEKLLNNVQDKTMTFCGYYIDSYKKCAVISPLEIKHRENECVKIKDSFTDVFHHGFLAAIWNKIYEVERLRENDIRFDESLSLGEDLLFNLEYLKTGINNFKYVSIPLYHYVKRGTESLDNKYRADFLEIQERLYESMIKVTAIYDVPFEKKNIIYADFMGAMIVAIDNYYVFRKEDTSGLKQLISRVCEDIEKYKILSNVSGSTLLICKTRYLLLKSGFFKIDFLIREIIKKILRIK